MRWWVWLLVLLPTGVWAQRASNWRVYKAADGLSESACSAVSVSARGSVYVKHPEADTFNWLDGYWVYRLPAAGRPNYPIYEVRTNHLWSLYETGIQQFQDGTWIQFPIEEIRAENQKNVLRQVRPLSLVPAKREQVLFLLPDQLMEFNSVSNRTFVVRRASDTDLGRFVDMTEARDGGIWIAGWRGAARLPPVVRTDAFSAPWQEFTLPAQFQVQNLQRPICDDEGGVTFVGESMARSERLLVYFDGQSWSLPAPGANKLHRGWRGLDGTFWAQSMDALTHYQGATWETMEAPLGGQIMDVAVEPKGVFWLSTTEGLARHAPLNWRTPPNSGTPAPVVHAIVQDHSNRLWFAGATALILYQNERYRSYAYPEKFELQFRTTDPVYVLPDGHLAINATDHFILFNPATETFELPPPLSPLGGPAKLVGQLRNGSLCVLRMLGGETRIETFDGAGFQPFWVAPPNWSLGPELTFCHATANVEDFWLGGSGGVALLRNQQLQLFTRADGEPPDNALCLLELADGRVWCGGQGKIHEFDGKNWAIVRSNFDRVNAMIQAPDGTVWVASSDGVYRYADGSWLLNGVDEGLPSSAVYEIFQDNRKHFWAGTGRGLSRYYPSADIDPPRTSVTSANEQMEFTADSTITLIFSGQDKWRFTNPERMLFSYRRDALKWTPFSTVSEISFKELTSGKHRVEVRAMDRNGNYDHQGMAFDFSVYIPWYLERRLIIIFFGGLVISLLLGALATNRHWRLKRSYAEVERIVTQRTRELEQANRALLHSQKMEALGTLAAGVAHDFNNILSIIKGSAQIIEGNLQDQDKVLTRLKRIQTVVGQGAEIVRAMLGYSRSTGKEPASCEINQVVGDTVKLLGDRFLHEIDLQCDFNLALPPVRLVKEMLQQLLLNLILNAADAMSGRGRVTVHTGQLTYLPVSLVLRPAAADRYILIGVEDAGTGMAPDVLARIFEPFFTTKSFSSRRGTGLGLSMVYEIAKDQGYGLQVESTVGQGSLFTVYVPVPAPGK